MSIAQNIYDIVMNEAAGHAATRVLSVHLKVGEMSAVVPSSLTFCWEILTKDGPLDGAKLDIEEIPVQARCRTCGHDFRVIEYRFVCPACGDIRVEMTAGRELSVQEIEIE